MTDIRKGDLPSYRLGAITDLTVLIEQALELADDLGLTFASIDLCSAMERLKDIGAAAHSIESGDHK
jgi:hypothetical protein